MRKFRVVVEFELPLVDDDPATTINEIIFDGIQDGESFEVIEVTEITES